MYDWMSWKSSSIMKDVAESKLIYLSSISVYLYSLQEDPGSSNSAQFEMITLWKIWKKRGLKT